MIKVIAILGATATGKSDLAIELARKFHGEIVSVDSRQVYRGLDLGSGKVTKREQRLAPHHLLDVVNPGKLFSVAQFKRRAERAIKQIVQRGAIPILVGGSHLYMRALLYNYDIPAVKPDAAYRKILEGKTTKQLCVLLHRVDPVYYDRVDKTNRRRLIRALEVYHGTRRPFSSFVQQNQPHYDALVIGIAFPREEIYKRIDMRVDIRVRKGMIGEVARLIHSGVSPKWLKKLGLEYRFITEFLTSKGSHSKAARDAMLEKLKYATHDFARKQMVWYRKEPAIHWIQNQQDAVHLAEKFLR